MVKESESKVLMKEFYIHYHSIIMREAAKFTEKSLKSDKLKNLAMEIANLNADYVINHIDSDNADTKKNIQEIIKYGFKKSTMGLLLSMR